MSEKIPFNNTIESTQSNPENSGKKYDYFRGKNGKKTLFLSPEAQEEVMKLLREESLNEKNSQENLEKELKVKCEDIGKGESEEAKKFGKLVGLFGSSRFLDVLYAQHPDFKGLPVEKANKIISEYLGNYLLLRIPFNTENLEYAVSSNLIKEKDLKAGLFEVLKDSALQYYLGEKRNKRIDSDKVIFGEFFNKISDENKKLNSSELDEVIQSTMDYYRSVDHGFEKPDRLIDNVQENRNFPDIYQSINIKEIADKKRLLIADEMGVGKSASAILAKECLGVKLGLIVAPSNVLSTWQKYLSDEVSGDGKQVGYFKPGQAPKILTIENIFDLDNLDRENLDYVLISQERLNAENTKKLHDIGYDMLIIDEVHEIKNVKEGVRAENAIILADMIKTEDQYLALLSGTPVPNKIQDVAMLLKLLYPEKYEKMENKNLVSSIINGDITELRKLLVNKMQMKSLAEHIEMPQMIERVLLSRLSENERSIYELLLEEDSLSPTEKIQVMRKFLLNPELLEATPGVKNIKAETVGQDLNETFKQKNKVLMFVNDYVEDVIRGDKSILNNFHLPEDVKILIVHGETEKEERDRIQEQFKNGDGKILLVVSGQTAGVGVDYSAGESVLFYNEPWTKSEERQERSRVYRVGMKNDLDVVTSIVPDSIEEGIHRYIDIKEKAVEKLLKGIPVTEIEKEILKESEKGTADLSVNAELARFYLSSFDKLFRIFRSVKSVSESDFSEFIAKHGDEYAEAYLDMGSRNYQANANRVSGSIIEHLIKDKEMKDVKILDVASGPEMLKRHIADNLQNNIVSMDMNERHFTSEKSEGAKNVAGSFLNIPFANKSFDFTNLCLSFHYTAEPIKGNNERLKVLSEMNRVLKLGGSFVMNMIYSLDFKDFDSFKSLTKDLGFKIVDEYTGEALHGSNYRSMFVTLQKEKDLDASTSEMVAGEKSWNRDALKISKKKATLSDSRKVISEFEIGGKKYEIDLNSEDKKILANEKEILGIGEKLKKQYGGLEKIPSEVIIQNNFSRLKLGSKYVLFKKLDAEKGFVLVR